MFQFFFKIFKEGVERVFNFASTRLMLGEQTGSWPRFCPIWDSIAENEHVWPLYYCNVWTKISPSRFLHIEFLAGEALFQIIEFYFLIAFDSFLFGITMEIFRIFSDNFRIFWIQQQILKNVQKIALILRLKQV